jgi:type IX secretion system substrate protein/putative metal-binding protein
MQKQLLTLVILPMLLINYGLSYPHINLKVYPEFKISTDTKDDCDDPSTSLTIVGGTCPTSYIDSNDKVFQVYAHGADCFIYLDDFVMLEDSINADVINMGTIGLSGASGSGISEITYVGDLALDGFAFDEVDVLNLFSLLESNQQLTGDFRFNSVVLTGLTNLTFSGAITGSAEVRVYITSSVINLATIQNILIQSNSTLFEIVQVLAVAESLDITYEIISTSNLDALELAVLNSAAGLLTVPPTLIDDFFTELTNNTFFFRNIDILKCTTLNPTEYYLDSDGDGYGSEAIFVFACSAQSGYVSVTGDCNDSDANINPEAIDVAGSGVDANCDGQYAWYTDTDGDGYGISPIISSTNASPSTGEADNNSDCDDTNASINPDASDIAGSGIDANCDGLYLWYIDEDGDGYGSSNTVSSSNDVPGSNESETSDDCDDSTDLINPGIVDTAGDGVDADCDGIYIWFTDEDGDGYAGTGTIGSINTTPQEGEFAESLDCDDSDANINPDAEDIAGSGVDANCDTQFLWYVDADSDGYGSTITILSVNIVAGVNEASTNDDCDDTNEAINPGATEILYNSIDDDCDPLTLDTEDVDGDGFNSDVDCDDNDEKVYPGAPAQPDGKDNDCDGSIDKIGQEISFDLISDVDDGSADIDLIAVSSASLPVTFEVIGPATLDGKQLSITGAGTVTVTASQGGNEEFLPAEDVLQSFCVNPVPELSMTMEGGTVTLTTNYSGAEYKWYFNDQTIKDTTFEINVKEAGSFKVEVTIDGCTGMSNTLDVVLTGTHNELLIGWLSIYPNPASNMIYINTRNLPSGQYSIRVVDVSGRTQINKQITVNGLYLQHNIDVHSLIPGTYSVIVSSEDEVFIYKVIKN